MLRPEEVAVDAPLVQFGAQAAVLGGQREFLGRLVQLRHQHAGIQRLFDEAERAVFHGLDGDGDAAMAADDDDLRLGAHRAQLPQQIQSLDVGQHQVHQDDVGLRRCHDFAGVLRGGGRLDEISLGFQQKAEKLGAVSVIFDYENSGRHRHRPSSIAFVLNVEQR